MCLLLNHRETFRVAEPFFLFSNGWSHRCDLRFFFSRTIEKLDRVDQISRTLETCLYIQLNKTITNYIISLLNRV